MRKFWGGVGCAEGALLSFRPLPTSPLPPLAEAQLEIRHAARQLVEARLARPPLLRRHRMQPVDALLLMGEPVAERSAHVRSAVEAVDAQSAEGARPALVAILRIRS